MKSFTQLLIVNILFLGCITLPIEAQPFKGLRILPKPPILLEIKQFVF